MRITTLAVFLTIIGAGLALAIPPTPCTSPVCCPRNQCKKLT
jgi:hypothetical protein